MKDAEIHRSIVERDRNENIAVAAHGPASFREGRCLAGIVAVESSPEVVELDWDNFDEVEVVVSTVEGE